MVEEKGQASGRAKELPCIAVGMLREDLPKYYHWPGAPEANRRRPGKGSQQALAKGEQHTVS